MPCMTTTLSWRQKLTGSHGNKEGFMFKRFTLETVKNTFYRYYGFRRRSCCTKRVSDGLATIYCPHTTAGITINEHYDPTVVHDMVLALALAFPDRPEFTHGEGNSAAYESRRDGRQPNRSHPKRPPPVGAVAREYSFASLTGPATEPFM